MKKTYSTPIVTITPIVLGSMVNATYGIKTDGDFPNITYGGEGADPSSFSGKGLWDEDE